MFARNCATIAWFFLLGIIAMCFEELDPIFSVIAGSLALITAIIFVIRWYPRWRKSRSPIKLVGHKLQDDIGKRDLFNDTLKGGTVDAVLFKDKASLTGVMNLPTQKVYLLFLNLSPQLPRSVHSINLRFLGSGDKPQVIDLQDANQETHPNYKGLYEGDGESWGWKGLYSPPIHIANGKNLYYYACFTTKGEWSGELSLRFYFVGEDARSVKISCIVEPRKKEC